MSVGARDQKIIVQRATVTTDAAGEEVLVWGTYATSMAKVFFGRGEERRQAAMEQGQQAATFQVRENALLRAITLKDRISAIGSLWDLTGIAPDMPARGIMEITAVRAL